MKQIFIIYVLLFSVSCNSDPVPKPKGYFKIDLPQKQYALFNAPGYPYTFEYPVYSKVIKDSTFFDEKPENEFWINIDFPGFDGRLHLSYKEIGKNRFSQLVDDAFKMTSKHTLKASSIDEIPIKESNGVSGFIFNVSGNAATGKQFFVTDSTRHFLRGALYFNSTPNYDSIQPVEQFLFADMKHLIETLRWKN